MIIINYTQSIRDVYTIIITYYNVNIINFSFISPILKLDG